LPLSGTEYDKPVRVCNECHADVDKVDFFSMRRHLTPLLLFNGEMKKSCKRLLVIRAIGRMMMEAQLSVLM
jgi:hypothetical protein